MPRAGRELEKLVEMIEKTLCGTDVKIKSPDYIVGVNSESPREVDISLRTRVGSTDILVILECRDRQGVEDVRWIEELATKRADVLASKAVAVSSSGFSEGATRTAARLGVELRTIDTLTPESVTSWFPVNAPLIFRNTQLVSIWVRCKSSDSESKGQSFVADLYASTILDTEAGKNISLIELCRTVVDQNPQLFNGLMPYDGPRRQTVKSVFDKKRYQIEAGGKWVWISEVEITADFSIRVPEMPISQACEYLDSQGEAMARLAEWKGQPNDVVQQITIILGGFKDDP